MIKKLFIIFLICCLNLTACSGQQKTGSDTTTISMPESTTAIMESKEDSQSYSDVEAGIYKINKYGNITLTIGPESMEKLGYEPADLIKVKIGDAEMEMPIGRAYTEADSGEPICCYKTSSEGIECVVLAINTGNLAETMGIAECHPIDTDPGFEWSYLNGLDESVTVYISMVEKQGYADEYNMHKLGGSRSNNREDYAELSDAEFANFRVIETTGMGTGTLFRSSSPINPALNRNKEADEALLAQGVRTVINMSDSESKMKKYSDYSLTNYADCDIIALDMAIEYDSEEFRNKLAEGFRFIISRKGPYLIHCVEGKDRTGFAAAILECLMGADAGEIIQDYMLSFCNYYGMKPGTTYYDEVAASNIEAILAKSFRIPSIRDENTDLQACAEAYLQEIGMSMEEISALKEKLGQDYGGGF